MRNGTALGTSLLLLVPMGLGSADLAAADGSDDARTFRLTYETTIGPIDAARGPVHVFVPLAQSDAHQTVHERRLESSLYGHVRTESRYGNTFWHGTLEEPNGTPIAVKVSYLVERRPFHRRSIDGPLEPVGAPDRERFAVFLEANRRVPVDHPVFEPILSEIRAASDSGDRAVIARAIYDWVVANMQYKKVGSGWGNGDSFWACTKRYGNCTDFHSLFNSLARSEGIPARFEIGFPVPEARPDGVIGGYHCWTRFYLNGVGWLPIDASEAFKHPDQKEAFYGSQPADRIHLTTGRDLELGEGHQSGPLNYFVYPHVEVAGQRYEGPIVNRFAYEDTAPTDRKRTAP